MNKLLNILLFTAFLFLISCEENLEFENHRAISDYFEKINSTSIENSEKVKYIDTLCNKLLRQENDSLTRSLLFKSAREYFKINQNESYFKVVHYAAPQKTYNFLCEFKIGLKTLN